MDSGPIVVEFDVFQACKPLVGKANPITAIATSFVKQYACFREETRRPPKRGGHHDSHAHAHAEKPRIGNRELSREAIARKEFLALINKLSPQNAAAIITQGQSSIRPDFINMYVDMIWDAMLRSPEFQSLYVDMLVAIDKKHSVFGDIQRIWEAYLSQQAWIPITQDSGGYDDFCDHVKAKKRAIASIRAWIQLTDRQICKEDVSTILLAKLIEGGPTDITLDGLIEFYRANCTCLTTSTRDTLRAWHIAAHELQPMTRFKLYDLWDIVPKK